MASEPKHKAVGRGAVMATRASAEVETDSPERALFRKLNFFPTQPWASRALAELILALDPSARSIWEPAAGGGHMSIPLGEYFPEVRASDIHDYGLPGCEVVDFLDHRLNHPPCDWIATNPPFKAAADFVRLGLERANRGVILLLRLQFNETPGRYQTLRKLAFYAPFAERVPMVLGRYDPKAKTATAYACYVWMTPQAIAESPFGPAIVAARSMDSHLSRLIPPGTKRRLFRADDPRRFAQAEPGTLFDLGTSGGQIGAEGGVGQ